MTTNQFSEFEHLPAAVEEIDRLVDLANHTRNKKQKAEYMSRAQSIADDYQDHVSMNGNDVIQFKIPSVS